MQKTLWEKIEAQFNELKTKLSAATTATPADAKANADAIAAFRAELDGLKASSAASDKTIADLNATVAAHVATIAARDGEITKLKADAKSAGEQAVDILAAAGLDPAQLPAAANPEGGAAKTKATLMQQWKALLQQDSVKAAAFFKLHSKKDEFWQ